MLCFSLVITFVPGNQLLLRSCNTVVDIVYLVWLRSTIVIPFDSPFLPHVFLRDMKDELKRHLDFKENFYFR